MKYNLCAHFIRKHGHREFPWSEYSQDLLHKASIRIREDVGLKGHIRTAILGCDMYTVIIIILFKERESGKLRRSNEES